MDEIVKKPCSICNITREVEFKTYGKFSGRICSKCVEEMDWTGYCMKLSKRSPYGAYQGKVLCQT